MGHSLCTRNPPTRSDKRKNIGATGEIVSGIYSRQTGKARHILPCGSVEETKSGQRTMGVRFRRASKKHHGRRLPSGREDNESSSEATRKPEITFTTAVADSRQTGKARHMLPCGSVKETRSGQRTTGVRFRRASKKHHGRRLPSGREDNESSSEATRKPDITLKQL
jgi:hypothetical protein